MGIERPKGWECAACRWYEPVNETPPAGLCYGSSTNQGRRTFVSSNFWCGGFTVRKGERSAGKG